MHVVERLFKKEPNKDHSLILPCIPLTEPSIYKTTNIGQAAYLRVHPEDVANTFYRSTPSKYRTPPHHHLESHRKYRFSELFLTRCLYVYPLGRTYVRSLLVLANVHSRASSIDHWEPSHDLLRLRDNLAFPDTRLLSEGKDTAHLEAILGPTIHP
jgi:hypothetical protein